MQMRVIMAGARVAGIHRATARRNAIHWRAAAPARSCVLHNAIRVHFSLK
jgi:hypothetical protein